MSYRPVGIVADMPKITPNLWFDDNGLEAAEFYCSIFPSSKITSTVPYGEAGPGEEGKVMLVEFELDGQAYTAINGGPMFTFTEAISLLISCETQEEADRYWDALTEGGEESQCGWLKDRYGLSWQVFPVEAGAILADPDPARRERAMQAMFGMRRLDVAALRAAADGLPAAEAAAS